MNDDHVAEIARHDTQACRRALGVYVLLTLLLLTAVLTGIIVI